MNKQKVLTIVSEDYDDLEAWYPIIRLREAGYQVDIASTTKGETIKGKYGLSMQSNLSFDDVNPLDYLGLMIPGGWAPDKLRRYESVLNIVRTMDSNKRVIGEICHAGWVLISADIIRGVKTTSTPGIKHDMINAGSIWEEVPAIRDRHIVSGRRPDDLPEYMKLILEALEDVKV